MNARRIAIGTTDKATVCDHLALSSAFYVLEIEDGRVASRTLRERAAGACGNHAGFLELLHGCDAVLCGGIGQGAADSLSAHGVEPVVTAGKHSLEDAISLYLSGTLATTGQRVCLCH